MCATRPDRARSRLGFGEKPLGSGDPLLDNLYAAAGDSPLGQLPPERGRTPRRRWRYGPFRALLLVLVLVVPILLEPLAQDALRTAGRRLVATASAASGLRPDANDATARHQASPPSASGAHSQYPLNHTFDAYPMLVGTP